MPLTLTVAEAAPRFTDTSSRVPAWRRLHAEADRLYPQLRTMWMSIFRDIRTHVDQSALEDALARGSLITAETLVRASWERYGDRAAREVLPVLLRETVERSAEVLVPETSRTLESRVEVQFNVRLPETQQAISQYAGEQIVGIGETTMQAVREVLLQGVNEGLPLTQQMQALEDIVGLTPRQAEAVERLRARLTAEGRKASSIARQVHAATRRALRLRAESIARTESISAAAMGQDQLWYQAAQQGLLDRARFRRVWIVTPDDRLCQRICGPIPGMNPGGVPLGVPFQTPSGPIMYPAAHPMCRCAVSGRMRHA
jgi:uncharacterized protein with gpF-like domain